MAERHTRAPGGEEAMRCHFQLGYDASTSSLNVNTAATPLNQKGSLVHDCCSFQMRRMQA